MDSDSTSSIPECGDGDIDVYANAHPDEKINIQDETIQEEQCLDALEGVELVYSTSGDNKTTGQSTLRCVECMAHSCIMWRRVDGNRLICNMCHLKRMKSQSALSSRKCSKELQSVRISSRKNKAKKKIASGFVSIMKNTASKNRRNIYKKKPLRGAEQSLSLITTKAVYHNGLLYRTGDIVSTYDIDGGIYFAQLRGFLQNDYCEKMVVITWLIPTVPSPRHFDPMLFIPGLDEDTPRSMDCFEFVCHAPTDLFKNRNVHTPFQRSQSNLSNLIAAVKVVERDEIQ